MPLTVRLQHILLALLISLSLTGCGLFAPPKVYSPSEAEQKLIAFCKKEGNINIKARTAGKTLWVFLALEEPIFDIKPSPSTGKATRKVAPYSLLSLDGEYTEKKQFDIRYDIVTDVLAGEANTYGSAYNENYTKKRQLIYQGLQETVFNVDKAKAPDFVIILIADVTKGLATKSTLYLTDLKQFLSEALPPDEYYLREATEILGDQNLIGDKQGRSIQYKDVVWPDFLTEQLKNRIRYKLTQSEFPPEGKPDTEIIRIAANTFRFYPFKDYVGIHLYNMREKKSYTYSKDQLFIFEEKPKWQDKGRYTTIRFDGNKLTTGKVPEDRQASPKEQATTNNEQP